MGKVKAYLADALERLQMGYEEVSSMSLVEINALLEKHEHQLEQANAEIEQTIEKQEWDVDCEENGAFICISTNKES